MVVLAASVVTKTGKGALGKSLLRLDGYDGYKLLFWTIKNWWFLFRVICSPGVSPVHRHEQNQNRGTAGSFSQVDRRRKTAYICGSWKCAVSVPALGGEFLISPWLTIDLTAPILNHHFKSCCLILFLLIPCRICTSYWLQTKAVTF